MIKKILIAYNESVLAEKAFNLGLELAKKYSASITVLNVIPAMKTLIIPFLPLVTVPPVSTIDNFQNIVKIREKILLKALEKAKERYPFLEINAKIIDGTPSNRIVEVAEKDQYDLIVMGSHGTSGLKRFFLGSTSDSVSTEADCPVLLIK